MLLRISATPCKAFSLYYTQDLGTLEKLVYIAILVGQRPSYFIIPSFSDSCHSIALSPGKGLTCPSVEPLSYIHHLTFSGIIGI